VCVRRSLLQDIFHNPEYFGACGLEVRLENMNAKEGEDDQLKHPISR